MVGVTGATFSIEPAGPFSWAAALDVVGNFAPIRRHRPGAPEPLRLAFPLDGDFTPVAVALHDEGGGLVAEVASSETVDRIPVKGDRVDAVRAQVARIFSLDHDGSAYPAVGERDPLIGQLMAQFPGLRPVCFTSPYETAAWAIISQRISMAQAARIQDRLIAEVGERLWIAGAEIRCFPSPSRLLEVEAVPGLAAEKVARLRGVARAALDGLLDVARLRDLGDEAGPGSVRVIPGIGPFWASGIYLRGCGIADVFPDEPLTLAALGTLHELGDRPDPADVTRITDQYRPYRMWVSFLLRVAANRGAIAGMTGREGAIRRAASRPKGDRARLPT
jgi:DNA-3-methyladenine glycosylase II